MIDDKSIEETAKTVRQYLDPILLRPLSELGLLAKDQISHWRFKNQVRMLQKSKKILESSGVDTSTLKKSITPDLIIPLIESSGDSADEDLSDMFSSLLVSAIDPKTSDNSHPSFAKVLGQLSPLDARILKSLFSFVGKIEQDVKNGIVIPNLDLKFPVHRQCMSNMDEVAREFSLSNNQVLVIFQNLRRLGICDQGLDFMNVMNRKEVLSLTDYGYSLCSLCIR